MLSASSSHPDQFSRLADILPLENQRRSQVALRDPNLNPEGYDLVVTTARARIARLGDLPFVVITAGRSDRLFSSEVPPEIGARYTEIWLQLQDELAQLSTKSTHIIVQDSGHMIPLEQPKVVVDALRKLVEDARAR